MVCKQSHATGLHGYLPKKKEHKVTSDPKDGVPPVNNKKLMTSNFAEMDVKCNSSSIESKIISMCVLPVKVSHSKSKKEFSTYAVLDNCRQVMFIKEDIQKKLGAVGREADITVKLILPPVYTKEDIPVDTEELATRENIKSWDHLKVIAEKLPYASDTEIGSLIGADRTKALEPQNVIPSKNGGPFAFRTTLGWCAVGPLAKLSTENSISCH